MTIERDIEVKFCKRLKELGYAKHNRIRLYGEEFDLISDPFAYENGFAVEAVCLSSGSTTRLRPPLFIVRMIQNDLARASSGSAA